MSKVEQLVIEHYREIQLPPRRIADIRRTLQDALAAQRTEAEASEHAVTLRIQRLTDERQKLLHLHYAEAVPDNYHSRHPGDESPGDVPEVR